MHHFTEENLAQTLAIEDADAPSCAGSARSTAGVSGERRVLEPSAVASEPKVPLDQSAFIEWESRVGGGIVTDIRARTDPDPVGQPRALSTTVSAGVDGPSSGLSRGRMAPKMAPTLVLNR